MKANKKNIQEIYNEIPNTWVVDGIRIDNYSKSYDHYLHGWRDVVIPEVTEYQRLGSEFVLINDIVTKEIINFTQSEIIAYNQSKAIMIDFEYKAKITALLKIPMEKVVCEEIPSIPQDIKDEKERLKNECNAKILALGITDFTFRKTATLNK